MTEPLWTPPPSRIASARLTRFIAEVNREHGLDLTSYDDLWQWSVDRPADFWEGVWRFADMRYSRPWTSVLGDPAMPGARWFSGTMLNFAENLLRWRDDRTALVFRSERGETETLTYRELYWMVACFARFLRSRGVGEGDRVVGFVPNRIETVVAMLATTSLGAIWSSCSPDFGFRGVMDRFGQIRPRLLVTADGYTYNGRRFDSLERAAAVAGAIDSIETVVVIPYLDPYPDLDGIPTYAVRWGQTLENDASEIAFHQLPFDHPVYVLYSSGTTGVPKAIVHGAGGTLIQHAKELMLHTDLGPDDVVFYYTTCGWMMWNWLISALMTGSTVVLYDGSPAFPDADALWRMAADLGVTVFGTSPKYLTTCAKAGLHPGRDHDLSALRAVLSTGAPLSEDNFEWVYREVKADVQLASISGGTDIISCFMLGSPISPVYAGEIQKRGLGMRVESWDPDGQPLVGEKGELVCTAPFPSMPVAFWNDPEGDRYRRAYFEHFPGVWRHGDWIEITPHGGVVVHGRSDATLNPGGIRIGTAEIYRQVESIDEVVDSIVVGQRWGDDVRVVLFVVLREGIELDEALVQHIRGHIRANATPRHVPARIIACPDVPRTISGKKVEIAVAKAVHGEAIENRSALANPEVLDFFSELPALRD